MVMVLKDMIVAGSNNPYQVIDPLKGLAVVKRD